MGKIQIMSRDLGHGTLQINPEVTEDKQIDFKVLAKTDDKTIEVSEDQAKREFDKLIKEQRAVAFRTDDKSARVTEFDPNADVVIVPHYIGG